MRIRSLDKGLVDFTPVLDAAILANNEIFMAVQAISGVFRDPTETRKMVSVTVLDGDAQNQAFDLFFFSGSASLGTINSTVTITDADAAKIIGRVPMVVATHASSLVNSILFHQAVSIICPGPTLYVGAVIRSGTPTFTASGMKMRLGFE